MEMTCIDGGGGRRRRGLIETMPGLWQATNWTGVPGAGMHPAAKQSNIVSTPARGRPWEDEEGDYGKTGGPAGGGKYYPVGPISSACAAASGSVLLALANRPLISAHASQYRPTRNILEIQRRRRVAIEQRFRRFLSNDYCASCSQRTTTTRVNDVRNDTIVSLRRY